MINWRIRSWDVGTVPSVKVVLDHVKSRHFVSWFWLDQID